MWYRTKRAIERKNNFNWFYKVFINQSPLNNTHRNRSGTFFTLLSTSPSTFECLEWLRNDEELSFESSSICNLFCRLLRSITPRYSDEFNTEDTALALPPAVENETGVCIDELWIMLLLLVWLLLSLFDVLSYILWLNTRRPAAEAGVMKKIVGLEVAKVIAH